ncbi:MAG TPA: hypothetical protein VFJ74_12080 [Gemmatimonadaceae bacterium]|nr:hypothetical protein [Gemmatimonadaceae bacterium]
MLLAVSALAPASLSGQAREPSRPADSAQARRGAAAGDTLRPAVRDSLRPSARDFLGTVEAAPVVTHHTMTIGGVPLRYTATVGMLPIRNDTTGVVEAGMFYVAYSKEGVTDVARRPITFVFNGGPGSSTVWLHMGAYGPRKVRLLPDGRDPAPPYAFEDNQHTLLTQTDLVFLDPVGTGYSRAARPELGPKFWGLDEDIRAVGEFVRLYLTRSDRWGSPKFVSGESYGTTRAAGLSGYLSDRGIALNGIALLSTVLNFETLSDERGNDIGFVGFLPSYAATAWYHKKLPADLQSQTLEQVTQQAARWAETDYALALMKGNRLTDAERAKVVEQYARFTGLPKEFVEDNDLRVTLSRFDQELLRERRLTVGRLDSRFTTFNADPAAERGAFDPSEAAIRNTFTPVLSDYLRRELRYRSDDVYYILGGGVGRWRYPQQNGYANVTPALERAFARSPHMRLYVAMGYYDMATPYYAVEYTLSHLAVAPDARRNITTDYFPAGHMMYIDEASMAKLRAGLGKFFDDALKPSAAEAAAR